MKRTILSLKKEPVLHILTPLLLWCRLTGACIYVLTVSNGLSKVFVTVCARIWHNQSITYSHYYSVIWAERKTVTCCRIHWLVTLVLVWQVANKNWQADMGLLTINGSTCKQGELKDIYCRGPPLRGFAKLLVHERLWKWKIHAQKPSTHVLTPPKLGALREVARDNMVVLLFQFVAECVVMCRPNLLQRPVSYAQHVRYVHF